MPNLTSVKVSLTIPYLGGIEGTWEPDETEQRAAWAMYVELVTRISVVELRPGGGLLHEALTSLYSLFDTTRKILREHGPSVARSKDDTNISFGYLAVAILNGVLRPLLAKWHPLLLHYEMPNQLLCLPQNTNGNGRIMSSFCNLVALTPRHNTARYFRKYLALAQV